MSNAIKSTPVDPPTLSCAMGFSPRTHQPWILFPKAGRGPRRYQLVDTATGNIFTFLMFANAIIWLLKNCGNDVHPGTCQCTWHPPTEAVIEHYRDRARPVAQEARS